MQILYEDNHCLAVNKPAPLLTQGPLGIPSLEQHVKAYHLILRHRPVGWVGLAGRVAASQQQRQGDKVTR